MVKTMPAARFASALFLGLSVFWVGFHCGWNYASDWAREHESELMPDSIYN